LILDLKDLPVVQLGQGDGHRCFPMVSGYRVTTANFPLIMTSVGSLDLFFNVNHPSDLDTTERFAAG
jgi:hypothetical protein